MKHFSPRRFSAWTAQIAAASLVGLSLRLFLVLRFPASAGDSAIYEELARNWIEEHVYGLYFASGLQPSDMRPPGYPTFLALLYLVFRRDGVVIVLAQAGLDLATCYVVAWVASRLVPHVYRSRILLAGLWLAATCPLVADYAAVPLTEVLATFLTAAALIPLTAALIQSEGVGAGPPAAAPVAAPAAALDGRKWFLGGLLAGLGTLVRPETPLLLAAVALVLAVRWRRPANWGRLVRAGALMAVGLALPLIPWGLRNWVRFHEVQFLAPRFAASPDEYTPRGLYAWTGTWLVRYRDVYLVPWNVDSARIEIRDIPASAFDSAEERRRVASLLDRYNATQRMTPDVDDGFAELARERTARHPLRTYVRVPFSRMATLWFTPRVELLPISGRLWPIRQQWRADPADFAITLLFGALNFFYVGLAIAGLRRALRLPRGPDSWDSDRRRGASRTAVALLVTFVVLRTAFFSTVETPEPRYVLECFPALLALGALAWLPGWVTRRQNADTIGGESGIG